MANRDQTLFVNVTQVEKRAMEKIAGKHGGLSAWARGVLVEEMEFVSKVLPQVKRHFKVATKKKNGAKKPAKKPAKRKAAA